MSRPSICFGAGGMRHGQGSERCDTMWSSSPAFLQEVCDPDMVEPSAQLAQAQVGWLEVVGGLNSSRSTSACQELVRHL